MFVSFKPTACLFVCGFVFFVIIAFSLNFESLTSDRLVLHWTLSFDCHFELMNYIHLFVCFELLNLLICLFRRSGRLALRRNLSFGNSGKPAGEDLVSLLELFFCFFRRFLVLFEFII